MSEREVVKYRKNVKCRSGKSLKIGAGSKCVNGVHYMDSRSSMSERELHSSCILNVR